MEIIMARALINTGRQSDPAAQSVGPAGTTQDLEEDETVILDLAAARRRLRPEAPVLWIPPLFSTTPGDR
jgi:hypothetical protein